MNINAYTLNGGGEAQTTFFSGVNVNVGGAVWLGGQNLIHSGLVNTQDGCTGSLAGTFEMTGGCYYYCDGSYRQSLNVAFNEALGANDKQACNYSARCEFNGIKLRPGDKVTAYKKERAANCKNEESTIICGKEGAFDKSGYDYSYCMSRDGTDEGMRGSSNL